MIASNTNKILVPREDLRTAYRIKYIVIQLCKWERKRGRRKIGERRTEREGEEDEREW